MGAADEAKKPAGLARYPRHRKLSEKGAAAAAAASLVGAGDGDSSDHNGVAASPRLKRKYSAVSKNAKKVPKKLSVPGSKRTKKKKERNSNEDDATKKEIFTFLSVCRRKTPESNLTVDALQTLLFELRNDARGSIGAVVALTDRMTDQYPREESRGEAADEVATFLRGKGGGPHDVRRVHVFGAASGVLGKRIVKRLKDEELHCVVVTESDIVEGPGLCVLDKNANPVDSTTGQLLCKQHVVVARNCFYHIGLSYQTLVAMLHLLEQGGQLVAVAIREQMGHLLLGIQDRETQLSHQRRIQIRQAGP